jgi:hypothetical protein
MFLSRCYYEGVVDAFFLFVLSYGHDTFCLSLVSGGVGWWVVGVSVGLWVLLANAAFCVQVQIPSTSPSAFPFYSGYARLLLLVPPYHPRGGRRAEALGGSLFFRVF